MTVSKLLLPPRGLASCLSAGIYRDTRGTDLDTEDRLNFFPASPLVTLTIVMSGQLHARANVCGPEELKTVPPLPALSVMPPQTTPLSSWSPGPVAALTLGFFPDAWSALGGSLAAPSIPQVLQHELDVLETSRTVGDLWEHLCALLLPLWRDARHRTATPHWPGSDSIADWGRQVITAAALSGPGRSLRAAERRLRRWTGHSRQTVSFFAKIENLHALSVALPDAPMAEIAAEANYSDQSHMGREVRRATGFSPARLNALIATRESFWCYRLLGERF